MNRENEKSCGRVLVVTQKFPNVIQPWLANTVAQIKKSGFDLQILTAQKGDESYAQVVDEYDLNDHVVMARLNGYSNIITIINAFVSFRSTVNFIKNVIKLDLSCWGSKSFIKRVVARMSIASLLGKIDADIVHSHSEGAGYKILPIVPALNAKLVITYHGLPPSGVSMISFQSRREYTRLADLILVNTEFARRQYVDKLGAEDDKIRILPQGIDLSIFEFKNDRLPNKNKLSLMCAGRLSKEKGHEYILEAAYYLKSDRIQFDLLIIGEGLYKDRLMSLVNQYGLSGYVKFESGLTDKQMAAKYQSADIFILASITPTSGWHKDINGDPISSPGETQGVVIQEAQACGSLVIATKVGGIPECVVDGENAFLVNERSGVEIYKKILWLQENKTMWETWRVNARRHVEEKYDIEKIGEKLAYVYSCLLANQPVSKSL